MRELRGKPVCDALTAEAADAVKRLEEKGIHPKLAVVRVGERADDLSYERGLRRRFDIAGALVDTIALPETVSQGELEDCVRRLNADASVHGVLLFRPLPKPLSDEPIKTLLDPGKDVDGMTVQNAGLLFGGAEGGFPPCTPQAVLELLDYYGIDVKGRRVTVVGRSMVLGKPLSVLLLARHATVTVCHTRTKDLAAACRDAEVLFLCAGVAKMIGSGHVAPGQIVIDAGMNADADGNLCGDADYDAVSQIVEAITPVPGGVGAVTSAALLRAVARAAESHA